MKSAFIMAFLLFAIGASARPPAADVPVQGLDHVMLWTGDIDRVTAILAVKLGFQIRPGFDFGDGVASRYLRLADGSYLELLYTTRPTAQLSADTREELDAVRGGPGARTFAMRVASVEDAYRALTARAFDLDSLSPSMVDPDGAGPEPPAPADYRVVSFRHPPLSGGNIFFITYAPRHDGPAETADRAAARSHPNSARSLTSIWLLSGNAAALRDELVRIGFRLEGASNLAQVGARGFRLTNGPATVLALEPSGPGAAQMALAARGPQLFGISLFVNDLDMARRRIARGYERALPSYQGASGESVLAPTYDDLGLWFEFVREPTRHPDARG